MAVKPKRTMVTTRMPAGQSQMDQRSKPAKPASQGMSKSAPAKMAGPKPAPKPRTSAQQKVQTLPYGGGKPKAKTLPGSGKAPVARKLGR